MIRGQSQVGLYRLPEVKARVGWEYMTIYQRVRDGTFPAPLALGSATMAWRESTIDELIASRPARTTGWAPAPGKTK